MIDETFTFNAGVYKPTDNMGISFGRGGELLIKWDSATEVIRGFLRGEIKAKKLGTCPAEPTEGDLALCF